MTVGLKYAINPEMPEQERMRIRSYCGHHTKLGSHCEICYSSEKLGRHHFDYTKPLEVNTFCRNCHEKIESLLYRIMKNPTDPKLISLLSPMKVYRNMKVYGYEKHKD